MVFLQCHEDRCSGRAGQAIVMRGMAIQGTPASMRVRFISWQVIPSSLNVKIARG